MLGSVKREDTCIIVKYFHNAFGAWMKQEGDGISAIERRKTALYEYR